ncbi:MAG: hypothetical protein ACOZAM_18780 [Pseudomonadota bacterium]
MSEYGLQLSYVQDDEYLGELVATVKTEHFSGKGSTWIDREQVRETLLPALHSYPLWADDRVLLDGTFRDHLRIAIRPYGSRGALLAQVDIVTQCHSLPDQDLQQSVMARFLTTYTALEAFARELDQVLAGNREWAVLASRVD